MNICIVVESYVHAYMTDGDGFYIRNDDDLWCFVGILRWRPCWWWYCMHIGVVSRRIVWFSMSHNCLCAWRLMWLMNCIHLVNLLNVSYLIVRIGETWWMLWLCDLVFMCIGGFCWWLWILNQTLIVCLTCLCL